MLPRREGARGIIRAFLLELRPGARFTNRELMDLTGIIESVRRLRELRDEEGFNILSHRDAPDLLKKDEYMLGDPIRLPVDPRKVGKRDAAMHLATHPYCDVCHSTAGDTSRRDGHSLVQLTVTTNRNNEFVVVCDTCSSEDVDNVSPYCPVSLVDEIMVAPRHVKESIFKYLSERLLSEE